MARWYGAIGYYETVQTAPGVYMEDRIFERNYSGEIVRRSRYYDPNQDSTNDDISLNVSISIIADPYAYSNINHMRYLVYMNQKWIVKSVEVEYPRLILNLGGLYNE